MGLKWCGGEGGKGGGAWTSYTAIAFFFGLVSVNAAYARGSELERCLHRAAGQ